MTDNNSGGLFGGLKKLLFKDEALIMEQPPAAPIPPPLPVTPYTQTPPPLPSFAAVPNMEFGDATIDGSDEQLRNKAYQLLESINQPGVDFLEVWNAAEEAGGVTDASLKMAFNALKYADKTLTRDKIITSGNYYANELQKALDSDLNRKALQLQQLEKEKNQQRGSLEVLVANLEKQIATLQQALTDKRTQLAELDDTYQPKMAELDRKMQTGKATISGLISKMRNMLVIAERAL